MSETAIHDALKGAAQGLSPARQDAFLQGGQMVLQRLADQGFDATVGSTVAELVRTLRYEHQRTEIALAQVRGLTLATNTLDARGQQTLALTSTLLKAFREQLLTESTVKHYDATTCSRIASAVSYIVWAYLTNGQPLPPVEVQDA